MSLLDQWNLSQRADFRLRVEAALVHAALAVAAEATNDIQTITITGSPTGGTFTLTYNGQNTGNIAFNASAGAVQLALAGLTNIGARNVIVTGGPGPGTAWVVNFIGALGNSPQALMTSNAALSGGVSPAVSVAHTTVGQGYVNHDGRFVFAKTVLGDPEGNAIKIAIAVADNATVQTDWPAPSYSLVSPEGTADNNIQFQVNSILNSFV